MATRPHADITDPTVRCAVTHGTEAMEFVDVLVADDDWVRGEFEAIVAAGWGGVVPPCPAPRQGPHWPRRPGYDHRPTPVQPMRELLTADPAPTRQRGPPFDRPAGPGRHWCRPRLRL